MPETYASAMNAQLITDTPLSALSWNIGRHHHRPTVTHCGESALTHKASGSKLGQPVRFYVVPEEQLSAILSGCQQQ